ncbi:pantoate--beta-alanine ligase [Bacillus sp. V3]|uniref:pantoate--beta-alanine ligase n=1 Tax=[Bacillus] enclensis TaxID=1402860 RepID=UPI0018D4C29F|nr:pantoate--beta-alanine ligase [[Bacillus] enclensis]QTC43299.1 pantoate--beta-alanine ligase [Bacillus sp. V3]
MKIITSMNILRQEIQKHKDSVGSIGFVPTMGFLHEGHLTLADEARKQNEVVVMSIFVNPLQFGPDEDFDRYPRDIDRDRELAENAGVDILFIPDAKEMYPDELSVTMTVHKRIDVLCGKKREGHFDGVVTILAKLFHLVQPSRAYFGLKDAQQIAVVEGMVEDYFFPVEIVRVPTVREEDGLAKSSRNVYLSESERKEAPVLYKSLKEAAQMIESGKMSVDAVVLKVRDILQNETSGKVEYVEAYSFPQLSPVDDLTGEVIIAVAVQFEKARLIDNIIILLNEEGKSACLEQ